MIATKALLRRTNLNSVSVRAFSYDLKEIKHLEAKVKRKVNVIRQQTELREFSYQPPQMYYDKKTGEIKVKERE